MNEYVILVDDQDNQIGTALKSKVHTDKTPLHRAFSIFLFSEKGKVLVQQRALNKVTWPGIWSNSCCGHVSPGESREEAIRRRVEEELGVWIDNLEKVAAYRYQFEMNGIYENEICPVYKGVVADKVKPDLTEIEDYKWMDWKTFIDELTKDTRGLWSPWCKEEVGLFTA